MANIKTALVIGAGITGIMTAFYLSEAGFQVDVVDEERDIAQKCSRMNGGQLSISNSEVWTNWKNVKNGIKWLFQKDAPLRIKPTFEWKKIKWLIKFLFNCTKVKAQNNTTRTIRMAKISLDLYEKIIKEHKIDCDFSRSEIIHIFDNIDLFNDSLELYQPHLNLDVLPYGVPYKGKYSFSSKSDGVGDPWKFCTEMKKILLNRGVKFYLKKKIENPISKLHDVVVICAGVGSEKLANSIGEKLNIYPVKGYSIEINNIPQEHMPKHSIIDENKKIVTSILGDILRVAGTAEFCGENYDITHDRVKPLLDWVEEMYPNIDIAKYRSWACCRPMTPNMLPIIRRSNTIQNVYYNTGHGHLGWTLAAHTSNYIVQNIRNNMLK